MDRKKFDKKLLLIFVLCLLGTGSGSYLLYKDLYFNSVKGVGKSLATLSKKESTVRRKPSNSFVWGNIQSQDDIYKKDSIQTGANSSAQILLKNNTLIELSENSLVVIDDSTDLSLNFLKGSVILKSDSGDKKITVDKTGKQNVQILSAKLKYPENFNNFYTMEKSLTVDFSWDIQNSTTNDKKINIQIAKDTKFTNIIKTESLEQNTFKQVLLPGKYFWRITQNNQTLSSVSSFNVYSLNNLVTTYPIQNSEISKFGNETDVTFRWNNQINERVYNESNDNDIITKLIISKDKQFKNILHSIQVNYQSGLATIKNLSDATYYWKIESTFKELVVSSNIESFKIKTSQKLAIQLNQPENDIQNIQNKPIYFTWDAGNNDYNYELKIFKDNTEVLRKNIKAQSISLPLNNTGEYTWKVLALQNTTVVGESEIRRFSILDSKPIILVEPKNNEPIYYWDEPTKVNFTWKSVDSNSKYVLELSESKDFKKFYKSIKTDDTEFSIDKLPQGTIYWRVSEVDTKLNTLRKSQTQSFVYGLHPPLAALKLIEPANFYTLSILNDTNELTFKWEENKDAKNYEFFIFSKTDRTLASSDKPKPIYRTITSDNSITLTNKVLNKFKNGEFYWSVRPIDQKNRPGDTSSNFTFTINYGELLAPPEVLSPEVQ